MCEATTSYHTQCRIQIGGNQGPAQKVVRYISFRIPHMSSTPIRSTSANRRTSNRTKSFKQEKPNRLDKSAVAHSWLRQRENRRTELSYKTGFEKEPSVNGDRTYHQGGVELRCNSSRHGYITECKIRKYHW